MGLTQTGGTIIAEGSDGGDSSEFDLDENELENMLDEALPEDLKKRKQVPYEERFKTVVEGRLQRLCCQIDETAE